jgi:hypothetical protein
VVKLGEVMIWMMVMTRVRGMGMILRSLKSLIRICHLVQGVLLGKRKIPKPTSCKLGKAQSLLALGKFLTGPACFSVVRRRSLSVTVSWGITLVLGS